MMRERKLKGTGTIRLIVVKHNDMNYGGIYRNTNPDTITIISATFFPHGFICHKTWNDEVSRPEYTEDMIREESEVVASHLEDQPNGFYEIIAGLGYTSWRTSYEYEEYEHEWDLLDPKIQSIKYEHAVKLDQYDVIRGETIDLMTRQTLHKEQRPDYADTAINQFMSRKEIKARHAFVLTKLYDNYTSTRLYEYTRMTEKELDDYIHMSMLTMDSESMMSDLQEKRHKLALIVDEDVNHCEELRHSLMDQEDE
jgi:hypothetical protein